jgi:hypothetical protein
MDYYVKKLGFTMKWDWGTPPTFGSVTRGQVEIFLCEGAQGHAGTWMSIFMEEVDALNEESAAVRFLALRARQILSRTGLVPDRHATPHLAFLQLFPTPCVRCPGE